MPTIAAVVLAVASMAQTQAQPVPPVKHRHHLITVVEHVGLGAGSYAGFATVGGPQRRWQVGISGAAVIAGVKEFYGDLHNGKDTPKMALVHFVSILAGAGIAATVWH